jgi:hypothetical protein
MVKNGIAGFFLQLRRPISNNNVTQCRQTLAQIFLDHPTLDNDYRCYACTDIDNDKFKHRILTMMEERVEPDSSGTVSAR